MIVIALCAAGASADGDVAGFVATPAGILVSQLEDLGYKIVDVGDPEASFLVSLDYHARALRRVETMIPTSNRILIVQEPDVVLPANYKAGVRRKFGAGVISLTPDRAESFLPWPQLAWPEKVRVQEERNSRSTVLINANKLSFVGGSLYGFRREVIRAFGSANQKLTLAGSGWGRSPRDIFLANLKSLAYTVKSGRFPRLSEWAQTIPHFSSVSQVGIIDDKAQLLRKHDFAVVVENQATYISEKLFDAIVAGCVPLFLGPPLELFGIPPEVAVVMPSDSRKFVERVRAMSADEMLAVREAGLAWLSLDQTKKTWSLEPASKRIAEEIDRHIRRQGI